MTNLRLLPYKEKPYIFTDPDHKVIVLFYVDNIQVLFHRDDVELREDVIRKIKQVYNIYNLRDNKQFLGIKVVRDRELKTISFIYD